MPPVTQPPGRHPLAPFDDLVNLERSRAFHRGDVGVSLERTAALFAALPAAPSPWGVHVTGSEGKTTTSTAIAAGLSAAGLRTALYTSPHLRDSRERFALDGAPLDDAILGAAADEVSDAAARAGLTPTWFDALTATARLAFCAAGAEVAVWEVGLGGRLDSTRLVDAGLCVITSISLEHTAILGDTVEAIAAEKAGILRDGVPVVIGPGIAPGARAVIAARAAGLGCPLIAVDDAPADPLARSRAIAAAAVDVAAERLGVPVTDAVRAAVARATPPGRCQRVDDVLYDGAHTVAACAALAGHLGDGALDALVFGVTAGRDGRAMLAALAPVVRAGGRIVVTRAPGPRGLDPTDLAAALPDDPRVSVVDDPAAALAAARALGGATTLVAGSLHLVGALVPVEAPR